MATRKGSKATECTCRLWADAAPVAVRFARRRLRDVASGQLSVPGAPQRWCPASEHVFRCGQGSKVTCRPPSFGQNRLHVCRCQSKQDYLTTLLVLHWLNRSQGTCCTSFYLVSCPIVAPCPKGFFLTNTVYDMSRSYSC